MKNVPHRFLYLITWSLAVAQFGRLTGAVGDGGLLEEVHFTGDSLWGYSLSPMLPFSLSASCRWTKL